MRLRAVIAIFILNLSLVTQVFAETLTKTLKEGLNYSTITTATNQIVHILEIDPHKFELTLKHAKDRAQAIETVANLARDNNAIAAINGGYFHLGDGRDGLPAGNLKIDKQWYGIASSIRAAVGWSNDGSIKVIDRIQTKTSLKFNGYKFPVHNVNHPNLSKRAVLYTEAFGQYTGSSRGSTDIVIQNNKVLTINTEGKTKIPENGYVYSLGQQLKNVHSPKINDSVEMNIEILPQLKKDQYALWQKVENILGGIPLLIENGQVLLESAREKSLTKFFTKRYARTALGILPNGHWVFIVVESSRYTKSPGMTLLELARFMKSQGVVQAINLDGGSSSTMVVNDKVVNHPEGEFEDMAIPMTRRVGDGILVIERGAP
jgi:exopolysaccharide biosynthesis protein